MKSKYFCDQILMFRVKLIKMVLSGILKKEMYVSPFIDMNQTYHFSIHPPDKKLAIRIKEDGFNGNILIATQTAVSKDLTDFNLFITLMSYPLMGFKAILQFIGMPLDYSLRVTLFL